MSIEELIKSLEQTGGGCGLISNEAGHWVVSTVWMQEPQKSPEYIRAIFYVDQSAWKPTIREALQKHYDEHVVVDGSR